MRERKRKRHSRERERERERDRVGRMREMKVNNLRLDRHVCVKKYFRESQRTRPTFPTEIVC